MTIVRFQRGITPKSINNIKVLVVCTWSDDALYCYEVSWKYLERFSS